ncbi:MAG: dihydrolipoyl dehydrogenase [Candidatus Poseidoniales archaeon]
MQRETKKADVVVIGAGSAGMTAYRTVKKAGKSCILIENNLYGTTCARVGCMPSKLLIAAAEAAHAVEHSHQFGVEAGVYEVNRSAVMKRVRTERERFVKFVTDDVYSFPDEDRVLGEYGFIDDHTLEGFHSGEKIHGDRFIIATGTSPFILPVFSNIRDVILDNEDLFNFHTLPKSLAVIGTGAIGLEIGQAMTRLGVRTSVFGIQKLIGMISDPEVLDIANQIFHREIDLHNDVKIYESSKEYPENGFEKQIRISWKDRDEKFSEVYEHVLSATGRISNFEKLNLHNTSLDYSNRKLKFDLDTLQCFHENGEPSHVFVAGDVTGDRMILHEAIDEGRAAAENAISNVVQKRFSRSPLSVIFTDPNIAMVGSRYVDLEEGKFVTGKVSYENQGRSRVILQNRGAAHLYFSKASKRFLGAEIIGPRAENLGHLLAWAHQMSMNVDQMLSMPFYHPVIEESIRTALRNAKEQL